MLATPSLSGLGAAPTAARQLGVFEPLNDTARLLPHGGRDPSETRAEHISKKAAAQAAKAAREREIEAQRAALLTRAPRLAVWGGDGDAAGSPGTDDAAAAAALGLGRPGAGWTPRFDHVCLAVSDVSHMTDFLTHAGGRACEGFLTPVYLSSTWEFSNCAELQVIAPVESFAELRKKRTMGSNERSTTTQAFWNGNTTTEVVGGAGAPGAGAATATATATVTGAGAAGQQQQQQPGQPQPHGARPNAAGGALSTPSPTSSPTPPARVRSTFLQRYLRRHGPSVHHVAFLVPNLAEAKARFQSFGYTIYGWSDRDPLWKEFFLTPKQSLGVVIQVAESGSLQQNLSWQRSSAMLSQTHLTPVVKRHIAKMNLGEEEWAPAAAAAAAAERRRDKAKEEQGASATAAADAKRRDKALQQQGQGHGQLQPGQKKGKALRFKGVAANATAAAAATAAEGAATPTAAFAIPATPGPGVASPAPAPSAPSSASHASPSHSSSSSAAPPVRLELLGLRMRCSSEWKARRQWGDMLQASHCTVTVDPRSRTRTLTFRWPQSLMYIAVDIEKEPTGWAAATAAGAPASSSGRARSSSPSPSAADSSPSFEGDRSLSGIGAPGAQWDGPKWLEMHAPEGASPVPPEAAQNDLTHAQGEAAPDAPPAGPHVQPQSPSSGSVSSRRKSNRVGAPTGSTGGVPGGGLVSRSVLPFSPTFTPLPLDPAIMRSRFVQISQPMPLPHVGNQQIAFSLVPLSTQLRAKM